MRWSRFGKPVPVVLEVKITHFGGHPIAHLKKLSKIPVIGNGNIFSKQDADHLSSATGVDGLMVMVLETLGLMKLNLAV